MTSCVTCTRWDHARTGMRIPIGESISCRASAGVWSGVTRSTDPPVFHPLYVLRGQPYTPYNTLSKAKRGEKFVAPNLLILPTLGHLMLYFRKVYSAGKHTHRCATSTPVHRPSTSCRKLTNFSVGTRVRNVPMPVSGRCVQCISGYRSR
jgi:hypothetical protein